MGHPGTGTKIKGILNHLQCLHCIDALHTGSKRTTYNTSTCKDKNITAYESEVLELQQQRSSTYFHNIGLTRNWDSALTHRNGPYITCTYTKRFIINFDIMSAAVQYSLVYMSTKCVQIRTRVPWNKHGRLRYPKPSTVKQ